MPSVAKWMVGYGLFLIACGVIAWGTAWGLSGSATQGISAVIAGGVTGVLAILMGILSGANNYIAKMVGIHLGMILIGLFALAFIGQAIGRWPGALQEGDPPLYVPIVITVMAIGSIVALVMVIRLRPPMEKRGKAESESEPME